MINERNRRIVFADISLIKLYTNYQNNIIIDLSSLNILSTIKHFRKII